MRDEAIIHELKIWPEYYERVIRGSKTFEVRKNDRDYQEGDYAALQEWCPEKKDYTGRWVTFKIGFVLTGFGLPEDVCVFSLINTK